MGLVVSVVSLHFELTADMAPVDSIEDLPVSRQYEVSLLIAS